jgi:hypothetical protein
MKKGFSLKTKIIFVIVLISILTIAFSIQFAFFISENIKFVGVLSYLINYIVCVISFLILAHLSKKDSSNLGFVFLIFTLIKFGMYFLGFRFYFMQDDIVTKEEYSVFFIPYLLSVIVEVTFLIRHLNNLDMDATKIVEIIDEVDEKNEPQV